MMASFDTNDFMTYVEVYVNLLIKDVIIIISVSINMTGCDNVCETITKTFYTNC
jgi:hypothetical protein